MAGLNRPSSLKFDPVEHKPPTPPSPFVGFKEGDQSAEIKGEIYLKLSACVSVPRIVITTVGENPDHKSDSLLESPTSGQIRDSRVSNQVVESPTSNHNYQEDFSQWPDLSRCSAVEDLDVIAGAQGLSESSPRPDRPAMPPGFRIDSSVYQSLSRQPTSESSSTTTNNSCDDSLLDKPSNPSQAHNHSFDVIRQPTGWGNRDDNSRNSATSDKGGTMVRVISAPLLDTGHADSSSSIHSVEGQGEDMPDGSFKNLFKNKDHETASEEQPGLKASDFNFSWCLEVEADKVKADPSTRTPKKSEFLIVGIRKADNLPEIWVMSRKPDLRKKESFKPRAGHETWGMERRGELRCEIKVNAGDNQYVVFTLILNSMGQADLLYTKLVEASNHIVFAVSTSVEAEQQHKAKIESLMNANVSNQFCCECSCKFIGVFDLWFSRASWTMVCTKCSNWPRRFLSPARHLWLDKVNEDTWNSIKSTSNAFMSKFWYSLDCDDQLIDCYDLLREDSSPLFKENVTERHIYAKYCNMKFLRPKSDSNRTPESLYRLLLQKNKDMPQIIEHVFSGVRLHELHREEIKERNGSNEHHKEIMMFVDFFDTTGNLLDKELCLLDPPASDCVPSFFKANPSCRTILFVYSSDKTAKALWPSSKLYKREMFELIPYPKEKDESVTEDTPKPEHYLPTELITTFYNHFLSEKLASKYQFKRDPEPIARPRIIGLTSCISEQSSNTISSKCCAILDNFTLYLYRLTGTPQFQRLDLRFVYDVTVECENRGKAFGITSAPSLRIHYFNPNSKKNSYPVIFLSFNDDHEMTTWKALLCDWINVTQSPLLHRQPVEKHFLGMFCNYAISILIGELMPNTCKTTDSKKHWLIESINQLSEREKNLIKEFSFKCDMPRSSSSVGSSSEICTLSPGAVLQLLVKFTRDHLMVPVRIIHKIQSAESKQSLVLAGLDARSVSFSKNYSQLAAIINSLSMAYKNTLLEMFCYFKLLVRCSNDLSISDVVQWLQNCRFCNNLFSPDTMSSMIEYFDDFFQIDEEFLKEREMQLKMLQKHGVQIDKKTTSIQVAFIRSNWADYEEANNYQHENQLQPIKLNQPEDFSSLTYGDFLHKLVESMTSASGRRISVVNPPVSLSSVSSSESLDAIEPESNTYLVVERLLYDKNVIRILPFSEKIDESLVPFVVLMECRDFLISFQMLALDKPMTEFDSVEYVKIKWDASMKQPAKLDKRCTVTQMRVWLNTNFVYLRDSSSKKSSSSSSEVPLCLSHYDLYFGHPSFKPSKLSKENYRSNSLSWKRAMCLIGPSDCHVLIFKDQTSMIRCFWSMQHSKLGPSGVNGWIPKNKMDVVKSRRAINCPSPVQSCYNVNADSKRFSIESATPSLPLSRRESRNSSGVHSTFVSSADHTDHGNTVDSHEGDWVGEMPSEFPRMSPRVTKSPKLSNRLSKSMDMLQEETTTTFSAVKRRPNQTGRDKTTTSRISITKALKKGLYF